METLKQKLDAATDDQQKENILINVMTGIRRKEQLNSITDDLIKFFSNLYINNKLVDADGNPIRNIKQFLIKVNANKNMSCETWYNNLIEEERKKARERDKQQEQI